MSEGFSISGGKGFHVEFANGHTVSVQFGGGNYCDNYDDPIGPGDWKASGKKGSRTAETAVIGPSGELIEYPEKPGDTVQGHMTPAEVLELMRWAASQ